MIRTKKNQNQFLPRETTQMQTKQRLQRDHETLKTQGSSTGSRLTKDRLKNQGKIHAKIGVNARAEEAPVRSNAGAEGARVRCNALSKAQGVHWAQEREFQHKICKKGSMKSLPWFVLGWMIQQRFVNEVIEHNGQGNHRGNTPFPSMVTNLLYGIYECGQKYLLQASG